MLLKNDDYLKSKNKIDKKINELYDELDYLDNCIRTLTHTLENVFSMLKGLDNAYDDFVNKVEYYENHREEK